MSLTPEIIAQCIVLLRPRMQSEKERRALVYTSLGQIPLYDQIDWSGSTGVFIPHLIQELESYGKLPSGELALVVVLKSVREQVGVDVKQRIDSLISKIEGKISSDPGSQIQDLSSVTVQIRNKDTDRIAGAGILVRGKIVTCGQVVREAGVEPSEIGGRVRIHLPITNVIQQRTHYATILQHISHHEDDIVILEPEDTLRLETYAYIQCAENSTGNRFRTYGYTGLNHRPSTWVDGIIFGRVEPPEGVISEIFSIELNPYKQLYPEMRGAAVLDITRNSVVGVIIKLSDLNEQNPRAIDAHIINLESL